jgi:ankyrin repeat protein
MSNLEMSLDMLNAVRNRNTSMAEKLLDAGENINASVDWGFDRHTALQLAVSYHYSDFVHMLLNRSSINVSDTFQSNGKAPIHMASCNGDVISVDLLLQYGAKIESKTDTLMTPLHVAVYWANPGVVSFLLKQGADLYARTCWKNNDNSIMCNSATPMDIAMNRDGFHSRSSVRDLLVQETRARCIAFMMGQHPRLGKNSLISALEPEIARAIYELVG